MPEKCRMLSFTGVNETSKTLSKYRNCKSSLYVGFERCVIRVFGYIASSDKLNIIGVGISGIGRAYFSKMVE